MPPEDSLLLNESLRERVAVREEWGAAGWRSWALLEVEAKDLKLDDIFLIARPGPEEDPLDRVVGVGTWKRWTSAGLSLGVAPILEAAWRAVRSLSPQDPPTW